MTKNDDITLKQLFRDTLRKGIPLALICILGALGKAGWDVYAHSKTNAKIHKTVMANEVSLRDTVNLREFRNLERKVDKILVGLCMINKKTCRLQD